MHDLLAALLILIVITAAYPWALWLLAYQKTGEPEFWLPLLLTLALSTGTLTLIMFWEALLNIHLTLLGITVPYLALMLPGWYFQRPRWPTMSLPRPWPTRLAVLLLTILCAGVLFNSLYWPFSRADAVGIYAHFAEYMADQRALAPLPGKLTVYEAYPILIPLSYSYTYLASGWYNEYLARLFPALLSLGCLGAIYVLGKQMHSRLAGMLAVLLLAFTPAFVSWASSGYVDLPMAFFYAMAAIFAARVRTSRHWRDALLAGVMMGLAAWTKNAALLGVLFLALWLLWIRLKGWLIVLALGVCAGVAAPWYLRNLIEAGLILPPTAWTEQSQHTLASLLVLLNHPQDYALSGFVIFFSVIAAIAAVIRRRFDAPDRVQLLLWTLPFFAAWWLFASYDPRFLLMFLPLGCVLAGIEVAQLWARIPAKGQQRLMIPAAGLALILGLWMAWESVEYKTAILHDPLMSADERRAIVYADRQPRRYRQLYGDD